MFALNVSGVSPENHGEARASVGSVQGIEERGGVEVTDAERTRLRSLAKDIADIASLPAQEKKRAMWADHTDLERVRPLIGIGGTPWDQIEEAEGIDFTVEHPLLRKVEVDFRHKLYLWNHLHLDMVVEDTIFSPPVVEDTGFGIEQDVEKIWTDGTASQKYRPQIDSPDDIEKIENPEITHYPELSEDIYRLFDDIFGDILDVRRGEVRPLTNTWDLLVKWWGPEKVLRDLAATPDLVHRGMERLMEALHCHLDQLEAEGLLSRNGNRRTGVGGYGYTNELPNQESRGQIRAEDIWGFTSAQIFSEVSPAMHEEFAVSYERPYLERFGLCMYGCCEPLHNKIEILRSISNLRKISMSPWADWEVAAEKIQDDYVFVMRPNPELLARDVWDPDRLRQRIRDGLQKTEGCIVEIMQTDISTIQYEPERLQEWTRIAQEEAGRFAEQHDMRTIDDY